MKERLLIMLERSSIFELVNRLPIERQAAVIHSLCEGNSIRATCRLTGTAKGTVLSLLVQVGEACSRYQDDTLRDLPCKRVQLDEIWSFVGAKAKNVVKAKKPTPGMGDVWTWTAICADTKLAISWLVGKRDADAATRIVRDLESRLTHRVQLTTDGLGQYVQAVESGFGWNGVDYAMLVKIYGPMGHPNRYSPPPLVRVEPKVIMGNPEPKHVSTSFVERSNLTLRMQQRRFTRLTNAFSKKVENHAAAVSLHFMWYNFARPHQTLTKKAGGIHTTPAMAAGVTDRVWDAASLLHTVLNYAN